MIQKKEERRWEVGGERVERSEAETEAGRSWHMRKNPGKNHNVSGPHLFPSFTTNAQNIPLPRGYRDSQLENAQEDVSIAANRGQ